MSARSQRPADNDDIEPGPSEDIELQRRLLQERAAQLGATAEELSAALEQLALQTEVVLHRLRGSPTH
jgi:hypothetical protein